MIIGINIITFVIKCLPHLGCLHVYLGFISTSTGWRPGIWWALVAWLQWVPRCKNFRKQIEHWYPITLLGCCNIIIEFYRLSINFFFKKLNNNKQIKITLWVGTGATIFFFLESWLKWDPWTECFTWCTGFCWDFIRPS